MSQSQHSRTWLDLGLAACGFAAWLAMAGCDGSATQTTTGKGLEGVLVDAHGNPVGGATVKAWPAAYGPIRPGMSQDSSQAVSTRTDEQGRYAISDLEVGVYNLFGTSASNQATVLIPRVKYLEQAADLGIDTLKEPGTIIGRVAADGGVPPLAFCYLDGSDYAAISDATGRFVLAGLAEGAYRLTYYAEGYDRAIDSVVTVLSGDTLNLAAKILQPNIALQPPAPRNVSVSYEPVYGVVRLAWHPVAVADLKEYVIEFEDSSASKPAFLPGSYNSVSTTDTTYTGGMMEYFGIYTEHSPAFTRRFWVRAKDREGNLSPRTGEPASILITEPTIFRTEFSMRAVLDTAAQNVCLETLPFALDVASSPDSLVRIQWQAKGYYHNSETLPGHDWNNPNGSVKVSIGAPNRDTLYFSLQTMDGLGAVGSQIGWDSVFVSAQLINQGGIIHSTTVPVRVDSSGCLHPSPAIIKSNGKAD